eukprot:scaffold494164_cov47-Prasinocladus_malaysianus.AAC.1
MSRLAPWLYNKLRRWWLRLSRRRQSGIFVTRLEMFAAGSSAATDWGKLIDLVVLLSLSLAAVAYIIALVIMRH